MNIKYITTIISTVLVTTSYADTQQIRTDRTITSINAYDSFVFINFTPGFSSNQGCTASETGRVSVDLSNERGRNIYSAALTAASAKKEVGFGVDGCHINRPKAYRIDVKF